MLLSCWQLKNHVSSVHRLEKVRCKLCGLELRPISMASHLKRVHQGLRPHIPCTEPACTKTFGSKVPVAVSCC